MNSFLKSMAVFIAGLWASFASAASSITPEEAYQAIISGVAMLVDVREQSEIDETGMAEPAHWLAMSEIQSRGPAYNSAIQTWPRAKDLIFYCRSGRRAEIAADHFASIGFRTFNMGAFQAWKDAGLPVK